MEFMFKRDNPRKNDPAQGMGEQQDQQALETRASAEIPERNNFIAQGHGKDPPYFAFSQVVISSGDILLFHDILFFIIIPPSREGGGMDIVMSKDVL
jgi:hypothetical protein